MLFAPFLYIYAIFCLVLMAGLFFFVQLELISHALLVLGLSRRVALLALLAGLIGSYVNIPLYTVESGPVPVATTVENFGVLLFNSVSIWS
jgi:uncharacterized membrane protein